MLHDASSVPAESTPVRADARRAAREAWHQYYSAKRLGHHSVQLDLIGRFHRGGKILEAGPSFGLLTAALANAGYDVSILDVIDRQFESPVVEKVNRDLTSIRPGELDAFDTVICCEILEHIVWNSVDGILAALARQGRILIVSVPYEATQLQFDFYINRHTVRHHFALKKLRFLKLFKPRNGYEYHKWEVGYRGRSLADSETKFDRAGWKILHRAFSPPARSVFHVLTME